MTRPNVAGLVQRFSAGWKAPNHAAPELSPKEAATVREAALQLTQTLDSMLLFKEEEERSAIVPIADSELAKLREQCRATLQQSKVKVVMLADGAVAQLQRILADSNPAAVHELPLVVCDIPEDTVAISYRHGGPDLRCKLPGDDDVFTVNANAVKALIEASFLKRPVWIDQICIASSKHKLNEAFQFMGALYAYCPVYSQINWNSDVDTYLSRGWVLQEFLLAEQLLRPDVEKRIKALILRFKVVGAHVQLYLRGLADLPASELLALIKPVLPTLLTEIKSSDNKIFQFLTNDSSAFWLEAFLELHEVVVKQASEPTNGLRFVDIMKRLELSKRCSCLPKILDSSTTMLDRIMKLQSPTDSMLGRLEFSFMTSALFDERDRVAATFGVYNMLSGKSVTHPCFAGSWPSIRGATLTPMQAGSGFGSNVPLKALPLAGTPQPTHVCPVILQADDTESDVRLVILAVSDVGHPFAIWTYANDLESHNPENIFSITATYAEEVDAHFHLSRGTIRVIFERLARTRIEDWESSALPSSSRYHRRFVYGEREVNVL